MSSLELLERTTDPPDDEIRAAIHGNYCRCTGYQSIVSSVREAAAVMRGEPARTWTEVNQSGPDPKVRIAGSNGKGASA
jgi:xanthine dehydrogenase iron-sulfur cluster and FAD-binding subunit A